MINLQAFEPFIAAHPELAAEGKYGVLVLTNGEWVPTQITESDFASYMHVHPEHSENQSAEDKALHDAAFELNSMGHSCWVLVEPCDLV